MTSPADLRSMLADIDRLLDTARSAELARAEAIARVAPCHRASARNLVHYVAVREHDLRELQLRLAECGLSSLGRSEPHVMATLLRVRAAIAAMLGVRWTPPEVPGVDDGAQMLAAHASALLGPAPAHRANRIMVTLPTEAALDSILVGGLVAAGMDVARINCAHDDAATWRQMAEQVRHAAASAGRRCLIAMDLAGPKLRTGPLEPGPRCVKLRPRRNPLGLVTAPATALLVARGAPDPGQRSDLPRFPVSREWLARRRVGDVVLLHDTRGSKRRLTVERLGPAGEGFVVAAHDTTYVATGTRLEMEGADDATDVGVLTQTEQALLLHEGDVLELTRDCEPAAVRDGALRIGCTLPEVFDAVAVGDRVALDDGKITGEAVDVGGDELRVKITHAGVAGTRLRGGKGINLPDTELPVEALTAKDRADLEVAAEIADLIDLSFVRDPGDVEMLITELDGLGAADVGIVLKIETRSAFECLPELLLTAMRRPKVGVMIARGDLAVECGYERLAELQEEILWLCEAAHVPVIWATQVLEQLAKSGNPSRAEISDAAMGERAECVMLNKGPYIRDAVLVLDDILARMSAHHYKKNALLRPLRSWRPPSEKE